MKRAVKQLLVGLRLLLFEAKKYKVSLFIALVLLPISIALEYYFRGEFVGLVSYLGLPINYTLFIALGLAINAAANNILNNTEILLKNARPLIIKAEHPLIVPLSSSLHVLVKDFIFTIVFSIVLWIISGIGPLSVLLSLLITYTVGIPTFMSFGVLFGALSMVVRGRDYRRLRRLLGSFLRIIIPVFYGVEVFPTWIQPYILLLPTVSIIEGTRRFVLGLGGTDLLIYSFVSGMVILFLSMKVFEGVFNWTRRTGKVVLE